MPLGHAAEQAELSALKAFDAAGGAECGAQRTALQEAIRKEARRSFWEVFWGGRFGRFVGRSFFGGIGELETGILCLFWAELGKVREIFGNPNLFWGGCWEVVRGIGKGKVFDGIFAKGSFGLRNFYGSF